MEKPVIINHLSTPLRCKSFRNNFLPVYNLKCLSQGPGSYLFEMSSSMKRVPLVPSFCGRVEDKLPLGCFTPK